MGPLVLDVELDEAAPRAGLRGMHLDGLLEVANTLRRGAGKKVSRRTPASDLRRWSAPGVLHVEVLDAWCHACSAANVSRDLRSVRWLIYGSRGPVRKALKLLWGSEDATSDSAELVLDGDVRRVTRWSLEHGSYRLENCFVGRTGLAVRHLPEGWVKRSERWGNGAHESPYWHPGREHPIPALGARTVLLEDVQMRLHELDVEMTELMLKGAHGDLREQVAGRLDELNRPPGPRDEELR